MADISVEFAGLKFKNPVFASSGPISDSPENVEKCCIGGAGAVVAKTVTCLQPLRVYPRPTDFSMNKFGPGLDRTALGAAKLVADESPEEFARDVLPGMLEVCDKHGVVLIVSILGDGQDIDSWVSMAQLMEQNGARALEINFSCPHSSAIVPNTGATLGMNPEAANRVATAVRKSVKIPIFSKMTSRNEDVDLVAAACSAAGVDGISVFNNQVGTWIDVENQSYLGTPVLTWGWGGRFMLPIALYKAAKIHRNPDVKVPVYGGTGIWTADDALQFIMLGNQAVQLCIAIMTQGYDLFGKIADGIEQYLDRKGIPNLAGIRGKALPELIFNRDVPNVALGDLTIAIDESKCNGCKRCESCMWGVVKVQDGKARVGDISKCQGCGWCMSFCNQKAMRLVKKNGETHMCF